MLHLIRALGRLLEWNPSLIDIPYRLDSGTILVVPSLANSVLFGLSHDKDMAPPEASIGCGKMLGGQKDHVICLVIEFVGSWQTIHSTISREEWGEILNVAECLRECKAGQHSEAGVWR